MACTGFLLVAVVAGCSEEQRRDVGGVGMTEVLHDKTEEVLEANDVSVDGDLDCEADIADDNTTTGSCTGASEQGDAIASTLSGTVDIDEGTCAAGVVVKVGENTLTDESDLDCSDL
jgi:hypothetical protein